MRHGIWFSAFVVLLIFGLFFADRPSDRAFAKEEGKGEKTEKKEKKEKKEEKEDEEEEVEKNEEVGDVLVLADSDDDADEVKKKIGALKWVKGKKKGLYRFLMKSGTSLKTAADDAKKKKGVKAAELGYFVQHCEGSQSTLPATSGGFGGDGWSKSDFEGQTPFANVGRSTAHGYATGSGVVVAVIDSGILSSHEYFKGRLSSVQHDFVDDDSVPDEEANGIDDDGDGVTDEGKGHGTFSAGIVAALAPDASIMPLRVLDDEGIGTTFGLADAIYYATANGADVINLSLGMPDTCEMVRLAVQDAVDSGVVVVVAAGNGGAAGDPLINYPASMADVIAVTSVDDDDVKPTWANYHADVALTAPGVDILAPWMGGDTRYAQWNGTSFSAPMVSAAAALVLEAHPTYSVSQVRTAILDAVVDIDNLNQDYIGYLGDGRLDLAAIFQ